MTPSGTRPVLGIDLGGTKIATAIVDAAGRVLQRVKVDTPASDGPDAVLQAMIRSARQVMDLARLSSQGLLGMGIGAPGIVDTRRGSLVVAPNLAQWHDVPIRDVLGRELGVPAVIGNDATVAALGEHRFGAGQGARHMVYLTVSTGIGGGIIIDGHLYEGASGTAGEIGHIPLQKDGPACSCEKRGCLESLASGTAIARDARSALQQGAASLLRDLVPDFEDVDAIAVFTAAARGDALSQRIIQEARGYLGLGLTAIVNMLNPEIIVVGGGVSKDWDDYVAPAIQVMKDRAFARPAEDVKVVLSALGEDVGTIGAAALALDTF